MLKSATLSDNYYDAPATGEQDVVPFHADDTNQEQGAEQVADLNDHMLMSQMKDSRDIHSEQLETPLRMTYDVQGQPSLQPHTTAGVQGI